MVCVRWQDILSNTRRDGITRKSPSRLLLCRLGTQSASRETWEQSISKGSCALTRRTAKCFYTAWSNLPTTPYVPPTVTPWTVGAYSGQRCSSANAITPTPAITLMGSTTMGCQSFPSGAEVMSLSVDRGACVQLFFTSGCRGRPNPHCNQNQCYFLAPKNFPVLAFNVVPATTTSKGRVPEINV